MRRVLHRGGMAAVLMAALAATSVPRVEAHPSVAPAHMTQLMTGAQVDAYLTEAHFHGYMLLARHGKTILSKGYGHSKT